MPITIRSPYSGQPVKVRDQDISLALRDEEGRIFYVVERSDGSGYYAAPTRKGSEKDEQRYLDLDRKAGEQGEVSRTVQMQGLHDATGRGRPVNPVRLLVLVVILLAALAAAAYFLLPESLQPWQTPTTPPAPQQPAGPDDAGEPVSRWMEGEAVGPYAFESVRVDERVWASRALSIAGSLGGPGAKAA